MEKCWLNTRYLQFNESDLQLAGRLIERRKPRGISHGNGVWLGGKRFGRKCGEKHLPCQGTSQRQSAYRACVEQKSIFDIAARVTADAEKIIDNLMPASITIVLPKSPSCPIA